VQLDFVKDLSKRFIRIKTHFP